MESPFQANYFGFSKTPLVVIAVEVKVSLSYFRLIDDVWLCPLFTGVLLDLPWLRNPEVLEMGPNQLVVILLQKWQGCEFPPSETGRIEIHDNQQSRLLS